MSAQTVLSIDNDRITRIAMALRQLELEMLALFPGRSNLIHQLILATLCQEHVLVFGRFGTAKTDLSTTFFRCFTDSNVFRIEMNKFMNESHTIGIPNVKHMRETGEMLYPTDGLLSAQFLELDEFFDANDALLRTLLGILNERQFLRGKQCERAKLHSAIAATNADPRKKQESNDQLGAIIDRFLFVAPVGYLEKKEERLAMYHKYQNGGKPTVTISWSDIEYVSDVLRSSLKNINDEILDMYDEVLGAHIADPEQRQNSEISDRRRCRMIKVIQAAALLEGRVEVGPQDILEVGFALDPGLKKDIVSNFKTKAQAKIDGFVKQRQPNVVELQRALLNGIQSQIPAVIPRDSTLLLSTRKLVIDLRKRLQDTVRAPFAENVTLHVGLSTLLDAKLKEIGQVMDSGGGT